MKLNYFLESDASKCCPANVLKKGNRVRWSADDTLMFGRIVSTNGNTVTVTDEKFGTKEKHTVPRLEIFQVLAEPEAGGKEMVVVWQKNKYPAADTKLKITKLDKVDEPVAEAITHERSIDRGRVNFKDDREVEEICLTRLDVHDLATLIAKVCVLQAYVDIEKEVDKDQDDRSSMEPESFEGEEPKEVNVKSVAEKAEDIANDYGRLIKERLDEMSSGNFRDLVKHYFSDLK